MQPTATVVSHSMCGCVSVCVLGIQINCTVQKQLNWLWASWGCRVVLAQVTMYRY